MLNKYYINAKDLINNVKQVKKNNPSSLICAMVKANAYGVGLKIVVKTLNNYVNFFGVSNTNEAQLVSNISNKKILIVGYLERKNINNRFSYACHSLDDIKYLKNLNKRINVHIKINTGMNRYGIKNIDEFIEILKEIKNSKLNFEGLFTHFATSDKFVNNQIKKFKKFIKIAHLKGYNPIIHADNSAVNLNKNHNFNMVRIGFNLYNFSNISFKPVVEIKCKVVQINKCKKGDVVGYNKRFIACKNMKVAVISIGYADGFSIEYVGMCLNINGKLCKVLNVCMDCFMLDVTDLTIKKEDYIYILNKYNPLKAYSQFANKSEYEVMCNFSHIRADRLISSH